MFHFQLNINFLKMLRYGYIINDNLHTCVLSNIMEILKLKFSSSYYHGLLLNNFGKKSNNLRVRNKEEKKNKRELLRKK